MPQGHGLCQPEILLLARPAGLLLVFVRFPVTGAGHGFLPAGVQLLFMGFFAQWFENALDHSLVAQLVQAAPETDGQTRQERGAQCSRF